MSHRLKLLIGLIALSSLPVLSACNTGGGAAPESAALGQEGRGADDVGEDSSSDRDVGRSGTSGQAGNAGQSDLSGTGEDTGEVGDAAERSSGGAGEGTESGLGEAGAGAQDTSGSAGGGAGSTTQ
jgi:hypothetical protein